MQVSDLIARRFSTVPRCSKLVRASSRRSLVSILWLQGSYDDTLWESARWKCPTWRQLFVGIAAAFDQRAGRATSRTQENIENAWKWMKMNEDEVKTLNICSLKGSQGNASRLLRSLEYVALDHWIVRSCLIVAQRIPTDWLCTVHSSWCRYEAFAWANGLANDFPM